MAEESKRIRAERGNNQKLKMLYLAKIFMEETDDDHRLTLQQIMTRLKDHGISSNRKTLYEDLELLGNYGLDILSEREGNQHYYYLGARDFELPELKLLVDSVQSAKFMTERRSRELIQKLETLTSRHQAQSLRRQVAISGRVKSMNVNIYDNVDKLHEAINANRQIRFKYYRWNVQKEKIYGHDGGWYQISPWALMWDDENYYLVGYDAEADERPIRHYRVDKMERLSLTEEPRQGQKDFRLFDLAHYTKSLFGMFGGEEKRVLLEAENDMAGILMDRFGKDIILVPTDEEHFKTVVTVAVSRQFYGWIFALGEGIRITGPEEVVAEMKQEASRLAEQYK